jgi:hypothetical protein
LNEDDLLLDDSKGGLRISGASSEKSCPSADENLMEKLDQPLQETPSK